MKLKILSRTVVALMSSAAVLPAIAANGTELFGEPAPAAAAHHSHFLEARLESAQLRRAAHELGARVPAHRAALGDPHESPGAHGLRLALHVIGKART